MRRNLRGVHKIVLLVMLFSLLQAAQAQERVVAYVPNWIDLPSFADTIDYSKVTHLNIAFENPTNDRGDLSFNRKNEALPTRAKTHRVPVLVSIGGGSASEDKTLLARYAALLTNANRGGFVAKVTEYVSSHDFAGVDLDLEGPSINQDYGPFVAELARALRAKGKLLTAALAKGYGGNHVPDSVFEHFDFVNIMAYDGTGPWNPEVPGQHSSLEFAKDNVAYWLKRGLPKSKAVLGVPFYGYGFGAAFRKRDYPYAAIVAEFPGAENADEAGDTIYYNGLPTIRAKAAYVKEQRLGGVMIWSLDYDDKGDRSLLSAIHQTLRLNR
jgi:GH18 family chitinase